MAEKKKTESEAVLVRMPLELIARLDDARREERDLPTRPEMVRRIVSAWLDQQDG
ncbi:hypothetical protein [Thioclava sp. SK-1]|uniref:hypothetical protein n=1 Tax=Thioclava sp. SK-1 TaxID=1889770 RepID=UPI0021017EA1|nr:hypothetical protein [Thioclava sp. SK-1]